MFNNSEVVLLLGLGAPRICVFVWKLIFATGPGQCGGHTAEPNTNVAELAAEDHSDVCAASSLS
jgi:hypothetical protein